MLTSTLVYVQYLSAPVVGVAGLVAGTIVWFFGEAVSAPTLFLACPAPAGPPELRGRCLGAANAMYGLGAALGPVLAVAAWGPFGAALWWWSPTVDLACGYGQ